MRCRTNAQKFARNADEPHELRFSKKDFKFGGRNKNEPGDLAARPGCGRFDACNDQAARRSLPALRGVT
jgi:hypothetical protein